MISIIVPTYNEKENVELLVSALEKCMGAEHEIIIVDDNSPDGTGALVKKLSKKYPSLRLLRREKKDGLTGAVVAGVDAARGQDIVVMDADLSHPPKKVPELASELGKSPIVIGSRNMKGGGVQTWPFHRKVISKGAELLAFLILGVKSTDPMSGFFAIKKPLFRKTRFRAKGYKLLLNILADNKSAKISEVPYFFKDRHAGKTKLGGGEILNYLLDLLRIRFG